jgi:hypothetical protein
MECGSELISTQFRVTKFYLLAIIRAGILAILILFFIRAYINDY